MASSGDDSGSKQMEQIDKEDDIAAADGDDDYEIVSSEKGSSQKRARDKI
jgi:hypothetical protein